MEVNELGKSRAEDSGIAQGGSGEHGCVLQCRENRLRDRVQSKTAPQAAVEIRFIKLFIQKGKNADISTQVELRTLVIH